jgi:ADP-heptose:LPS heptosyltransferase
VANYLYDKWGIATVVTAGPGQEGIAEEVVSAGEKAARLGVGLSLGELTALIESAALFVGNDSGPMHIAAAFDRPIVALFGSSDLSVWHPWTGAPYRLVSNDVEIGNTTLRPSRGSIAEIAAERVVEAVDDVLGEQARREKTRLEETPQSV